MIDWRYIYWNDIAKMLPKVNKLTVKSIYFKFLKKLKEIGVDIRNNEADYIWEKMGREEKAEYDLMLKALAIVGIVIVAVVFILIK